MSEFQAARVLLHCLHLSTRASPQVPPPDTDIDNLLYIFSMASADNAKASNAVTGDSGPGTGLKDLLPIPTDVEFVTGPERQETSNALEEDATLSHALATDDHESKGLAQQDHESPEVLDLGWNEKKQDIPQPLVGGMNNEELWLLVRRFDKARRIAPRADDDHH